MLQVLGQHLAQMVLIDDQQLAGELPPQGSDHPGADSVRSGRLRRTAQNPDSLRCELGAGGTGELARAALIRNLTEAARSPRSIRKLRAACVARVPSGWAVIPARRARRVSCSMTIGA